LFTNVSFRLTSIVAGEAMPEDWKKAEVPIYSQVMEKEAKKTETAVSGESKKEKEKPLNKNETETEKEERLLKDLDDAQKCQDAAKVSSVTNQLKSLGIQIGAGGERTKLLTSQNQKLTEKEERLFKDAEDALKRSDIPEVRNIDTQLRSLGYTFGFGGQRYKILGSRV
jgi:hypothetical protein